MLYPSFVTASIICSLHDVIHEDFDVGEGSIECYLEWNDGLLIDGDVSFRGVVQDLIRRHLSWREAKIGGGGDGICGPCSFELSNKTIRYG